LERAIEFRTAELSAEHSVSYMNRQKSAAVSAGVGGWQDFLADL